MTKADELAKQWSWKVSVTNIQSTNMHNTNHLISQSTFSNNNKKNDGVMSTRKNILKTLARNINKLFEKE